MERLTATLRDAQATGEDNTVVGQFADIGIVVADKDLVAFVVDDVGEIVFVVRHNVAFRAIARESTTTLFLRYFFIFSSRFCVIYDL